MGDDNEKTENEKPDESFAELFESYAPEGQPNLEIGSKVVGKIVSIGKDSVFVDSGMKIDAVVDRQELLDENGELPFNVGDPLELYVVELKENEIRLSKAFSGPGRIELLREAFQKQVPLEGKVMEQIKGGYRIEIMQRRAFCPISQIDLKSTAKPEAHIGESYLFLIKRFESSGKNIVVSRRDLLAQEQQKARGEFLATLEPGSVLEGKVTRLMPYGAFVELIPGVEGMVHVSELSWSRVEKPEEIVKPGDPLTVKLTGIEPSAKGQVRISLSVKQATENPWENRWKEFQPGERIKGKVTRCTDFGAFVEIAPGIEGLVHISEMSYKKRIFKAEEVVRPGETIDVMVKEIDPARRRISLSIREAEGDPWSGVGEKYAVGQAREGTLEKKEKFGYFVTLEPGITGLLPKSKISRSDQASALEKKKAGDPITCIIDEIKPSERKITLGLGDAKDEGDWQKFSKREEKQQVGALGEKLQEALKSKK
jgi:small subunit ribosomal protein S1